MASSLGSGTGSNGVSASRIGLGLMKAITVSGSPTSTRYASIYPFLVFISREQSKDECFIHSNVYLTMNLLLDGYE